MKMSVDLIARAVWQPAVDVPIVKFKTVQDFYVIVEVFRMDYEDVFLVGDVEAPVLIAVVVNGSQIGAEVVGTLCVLSENVETLQAVILHLQLDEILEKVRVYVSITYCGAVSTRSFIVGVLLFHFFAARWRR